MKLFKVFLKNWLILSFVLFILIACAILVLFFNAQNGYPDNIKFFFVANEVNIPLVLWFSAIISVFVGMLFAIYDFHVPKQKTSEEVR
ncbi:MAG: hypothetical protein PHN69_00865 [Candidatus Pacebacteria bacterium]|nr:hypothetical protein [Candidatus Paceibacterota bacterium]